MAKILLAMAAAVVSTLAASSPAECAYCPDYTCFSRCGRCACMARGPGGGECVSLRAVPELERAGYVELE